MLRNGNVDVLKKLLMLLVIGNLLLMLLIMTNISISM